MIERTGAPTTRSKPDGDFPWAHRVDVGLSGSPRAEKRASTSAARCTRTIHRRVPRRMIRRVRAYTALDRTRRLRWIRAGSPIVESMNYGTAAVAGSGMPPRDDVTAHPVVTETGYRHRRRRHRIAYVTEGSEGVDTRASPDGLDVQRATRYWSCSTTSNGPKATNAFGLVAVEPRRHRSRHQSRAPPGWAPPPSRTSSNP